MKLRVINIVLISFFCMFLFACNNGNEAYFEGNYLIFNSKKYIEINGTYNLSDKLCETPDGWTIYEVAGDDEHNYLEVSSFMDNYLYVKESISFDTSKIVEVGIGTFPDNYSSDEKLIETVTKFIKREQSKINDDKIIGQYDFDGICICVKYENDVVGHRLGYLMTYNGKNVFYRFLEKTITEVSDEEMKMFN